MLHLLGRVAAIMLAPFVLSGVAMAQAPAAPPTVSERLAETAAANRLRLDHNGGRFSGAGWDRLVEEGQAARMFLLGEEHGIAENPQLAAALFTELVPAGYTRFVIEVSPPMADALDTSARHGVEGLRQQFVGPGAEPAFFGMKEEAELLAAVRAAVPGKAPVLLGVDYEVGGDRLLIARLGETRVPKSAQAPYAALKAAAEASWVAYADTRDISKVFSFSGDPALVRAVRDAWPKRDAQANRILDALEETLEINQMWVAGRGFDSNRRRSEFLRSNFLAHWQAASAKDRSPRLFAKLGASHLVRGRNMSEVHDIGSLAPELAAASGGHSFHLMVLPGKGASTAVLNPATWLYDPSSPKDDYMKGLGPIVGAAFPDAFTLIDLRPLRPILGRWREGTDPELMRVVHGFDMLLVMSGSTPSTNLKVQ